MLQVSLVEARARQLQEAAQAMKQLDRLLHECPGILGGVEPAQAVQELSQAVLSRLLGMLSEAEPPSTGTRATLPTRTD